VTADTFLMSSSDAPRPTHSQFFLLWTLEHCWWNFVPDVTSIAVLLPTPWRPTELMDSTKARFISDYQVFATTTHEYRPDIASCHIIKLAACHFAAATAATQASIGLAQQSSPSCERSCPAAQSLSFGQTSPRGHGRRSKSADVGLK
jgi:hypothetical protein